MDIQYIWLYLQWTMIHSAISAQDLAVWQFCYFCCLSVSGKTFMKKEGDIAEKM